MKKPAAPPEYPTICRKRVVYRICSDNLHDRLERFVAAERVRTGWSISHNDVVERALSEFLGRMEKGAKR